MKTERCQGCGWPIVETVPIVPGARVFKAVFIRVPYVGGFEVPGSREYRCNVCEVGE